MSDEGFDVLFCDDSKSMEKAPPLTPEELQKEKMSESRLIEKYFGKKPQTTEGEPQ